MPSSDIIYIRNLKIFARIGNFAWEQHILQPVIFDIEMTTDIRSAAQSELLADTIDYANLVKRLENFIATKAFSLLERLAEETAQLILTEFKTQHVRLKVSKYAILPNAIEAGIILERSTV